MGSACAKNANGKWMAHNTFVDMQASDQNMWISKYIAVYTKSVY